jgi:hypothetical protein
VSSCEIFDDYVYVAECRPAKGQHNQFEEKPGNTLNDSLNDGC